MPLPLFVQRQLNYVQNVVVEMDFPEKLMASGTLLPVSTELPAGAQSYTYKLLTYMGSAAILANGADDIPMINAFAEERVGRIRTLVDGYEYSIEDMEAAEFAGMNLDTAMAVGARDILEARFDVLAYTGDADFNLLGLLNYPSTLAYAVVNDGGSNGGTNSTQWIHKTPAQIFRDLRAFAANMRVQTNGVESMEVILLPQNQFEIAAATPFPDGGATTTVLSFFLQTQQAQLNAVTSVIPVPYLTNQMIGYRRREDKVRLHMPLDFTQEPVQVKNFVYRVPCRIKTGGVQVMKPFSISTGTGI